MDKLYRLDRQAFTINTFESAAHQRAYWLSKPARERLAAAWILTCRAWNLDPNGHHPLDRSSFSMRRHSEDIKPAAAHPKDLDDLEHLS